MFEFTPANANKGDYVCPPDAEPAWRAAFEAGCDMKQLEANLHLSSEERLVKHDKLPCEWPEFESFMEKIYIGWIFIHSQHVYTR